MSGAQGGPTNTRWLESLSPWPIDGFGLARIEELLRRLGSPERAFPAVHVVGSNGKSTTTRVAAGLLSREGLRAGSYVSPHVRTWSERIQVEARDVDLEAVLAPVRAHAEDLRATQFEVLTAAALRAFADEGVEVAVVEAGLGGRYDATNVLRSPVQVLTNVTLEHTNVLGGTREVIAGEKLAVVQSGATVVLGEPEWESLARANGAAEVVIETGGNAAVARAAASAFLGRRVGGTAEAVLPGRLELRGEKPFELWDGAHNAAAVAYLVRVLPPRDFVVCASILADKDVDAMLSALSGVGTRFVATTSSNPRALPAWELARRARPRFEAVEAHDTPAAALTRARELAGPGGAVLVTGSLYLLADLSRAS